MVLHTARKFGKVEIVYEGDEEISFIVTKPSGKISIFLPYTKQEMDVNVYGAYGSYGAYVSGYSFTSESMVQKKKGKQFISFTPNEEGEHTIKVLGTKIEEKITV